MYDVKILVWHEHRKAAIKGLEEAPEAYGTAVRK